MKEELTAKAERFLPLTEATLYILISLCKPLHGYGVIQAIRDMSSDRVTMGPGTLYGAFNRLLQQKLIARIDDTETTDDRRKLYCLTDMGREVLRLEIIRLSEMVRHGETALRETGGENNDDTTLPHHT